MKPQIGVIRGATEKEVKSKQFNIYIGISLGNKWFTRDNIKKAIIWGLKYTKERYCVLIADTLHSINYEVRNKMSHEKAIKKSFKEGDKFERIVKSIISELPKDKQKIIEIIRWDEVKKSPFNKKSIPFFSKEFESNSKFKKEVVNIVSVYMKKGTKKFNKKEIEKLCKYVLMELPEVLHGFTYKGTYYNCWTYPHDNSLARMTEKIQNKKSFPGYYNKIGLNKGTNIFVELKI